MLIFSALVPHPVVATPTANKETLQKIKKTLNGFETLEERLYTTHPDLIICLTATAKNNREDLTINFSRKYKVDLKEFGDLTTNNEFDCDLEMPSKIYEKLDLYGIKTKIESEEILNYRHSLPLVHLLKHLPSVKIIPLSIGEINFKTALRIGEVLRDIILPSNKRIALIVSGNLSHALLSDAPAGFNPNGEKFDKRFRELLANKNLSGLMQTDEEIIKDASQTIFNQALIFLSIIQNLSTHYNELAYEAPFGVGFLTADFEL